MELNFKPRYSMTDIFHREDERLKTFSCWPLKWLDKKQLAMTGMFYTGEGDKTKCYFCEVEIYNWEYGDHPVTEHLRHSPKCPLLNRRTTNNIPINWNTLNQILPQSSYDICGIRECANITFNVLPDKILFSSNIPIIDKKNRFKKTTVNYSDYLIKLNKKHTDNITCTSVHYIKYFIICQIILILILIILLYVLLIRTSSI